MEFEVVVLFVVIRVAEDIICNNEHHFIMVCIICDLY